MVHQHGRRFIVLEHQHGCRDVMGKRSIDEFVKPGERLIGIGMLANIIPINILQVVNERFCIEGRIIPDLSFVVWKAKYFTLRR